MSTKRKRLDPVVASAYLPSVISALDETQEIKSEYISLHLNDNIAPITLKKIQVSPSGRKGFVETDPNKHALHQMKNVRNIPNIPFDEFPPMKLIGMDGETIVIPRYLNSPFFRSISNQTSCDVAPCCVNVHIHAPGFTEKSSDWDVSTENPIVWDLLIPTDLYKHINVQRNADVRCRFLCLPFVIRYHDERGVEHEAHLIACVIDFHNKKIEIVDSNGYSDEFYENVLCRTILYDTLCVKHLKLDGFELVGVVENTLPIITHDDIEKRAPQRKDDNLRRSGSGNCGYWTCLYFTLRVMNPDASCVGIVAKLHDINTKDPDYILRFQRFLHSITGHHQYHDSHAPPGRIRVLTDAHFHRKMNSKLIQNVKAQVDIGTRKRPTTRMVSKSKQTKR